MQPGSVRRAAVMGGLLVCVLTSTSWAGDPTGACCLYDGDCVIRTEAQCAAQDGTYQGDGSSCDDVECVMLGSCCFIDGFCEDHVTEDECLALPPEGLGGSNWIAALRCDEYDCPVLGACCFVDCDECQELGEAECIAEGGIYQGELVLCDTIVCEPYGACCFETGGCTDIPEGDCTALGGTWYECIPCADEPCLDFGACCYYDGSCENGLLDDECFADPDAVSWEAGELCGDVNCPPYGACCFEAGLCQELPEEECYGAGGLSWSGGDRCVDTYCPYVQQIDFEFDVAPGAMVLPFSRFDELNGQRQLEQVIIELDGQVSIEAQVTNLSADAYAHNVVVSGEGFMGAAYAVLLVFREFEETFAAPPIPPQQTHDFGEIVIELDGSAVTAEPEDLVLFIGETVLGAVIYVNGVWTFNGQGNLEFETSNFTASGTMIVRYLYSMGSNACCLDDGTCINTVSEGACASLGGVFHGTEGSCLDVACPDVSCICDINGDGLVDVSDLLSLLAAWGTDDVDADFTGDGTVDVEDLLVLLAAWGDCP